MSFFSNLDEDIEHILENTTEETIRQHARECQQGKCHNRTHCFQGAPRYGKNTLPVCALVVLRRIELK